MFCPQCGQEKISDATSFCSRCGFPLAGASELLRTGGFLAGSESPQNVRTASPRNRGLKQGLFIFLMTLLVVPIVAIITVATKAPIWGIPISAIFLCVGGLLRMVYALMFESAIPAADTGLQINELRASESAAPTFLPAGQSIPVDVYASPKPNSWRETDELETTSVTESATKLLDENDIRQ